MTHFEASVCTRKILNAGRKDRGFVLLSVIVLLALLASLVLMAVSVTDTQMSISADLSSTARLDYAAESALEHAAWVLNQHGGCSGYPDMNRVAIGDAQFVAEVVPKSGSPVTLRASATLGDIAERQISRETAVFDRADLRAVVLDTPSQIKDVYLEGENGHLDHNKETDKKIIVSAEQNKLDHALIEFDLTELPPSVRVESAQLSLEQNKSGSLETVLIYRVTRGWLESEATWEEAQSDVAWSEPGGDYAGTPVATFQADGLGAKTIDLTTLVSDWADGVFPNYGILLRSEEASKGKPNEFVSSDDGGAGYPVLTIVFSCECGLPCSGTRVGDSRRAVAHWRLDDGSGETAADSAGSHDGVVTNGPVWSGDGARDGSLEFAGRNDFVLVPHDDQLLFSDALTITAWVKARIPGWTFGYDIISKETPGTGDNFWLHVDQTGLLFGVESQLFAASTAISADRWHHVAATYDAAEGEVRLYVDGVLEVTHTTSVLLTPNDEPIYLGSNWARAYPWQGHLDDIQLFDVALTDEEIAAVMNGAETGGSTPVYETYRDRFDSRTFDQSDGTLNWSTAWLEVGESNGAIFGDIQVRVDRDSEFALRVRDNDNGGEGVQREFDLLGCTKATLAFDYRRNGLDGASDYVSVAMSKTGGSSWVELTRLSGPGTDADELHYAADISEYLSASTRLRFLSSPSLGGLDEIWFDNVSVLCE